MVKDKTKAWNQHPRTSTLSFDFENHPWTHPTQIVLSRSTLPAKPDQAHLFVLQTRPRFSSSGSLWHDGKRCVHFVCYLLVSHLDALVRDDKDGKSKTQWPIADRKYWSLLQVGRRILDWARTRLKWRKEGWCMVNSRGNSRCYWKGMAIRCESGHPTGADRCQKVLLVVGGTHLCTILSIQLVSPAISCHLWFLLLMCLWAIYNITHLWLKWECHLSQRMCQILARVASQIDASDDEYLPVISLAVNALDMLVKIKDDLVGNILRRMLAAIVRLNLHTFIFAIFVIVSTDLFQQFSPLFSDLPEFAKTRTVHSTYTPAPLTFISPPTISSQIFDAIDTDHLEVLFERAGVF